MKTLLLLSLALAGCSRDDADSAAPDPSSVDADGGGGSATFDCEDADVSTFYADADADGFGDATASQEACEAPAGFVTDDTDCDDASASVYPGATEVCDGIDNNCDGLADDGQDASSLQAWFADADGDGFGDPSTTLTRCAAPAGFVADDTDCDDAAAAVNPSAEEVCNALDDDCDGTVDGELATDATTWFADTDGDGFGSTSSTVLSCAQPSGFVADATDCDDAVAEAFPGNIEVCDGIDNDCSGAVDGDDATDQTTWYADLDADGSGDASSATVSCEAPEGAVSSAGDCDDGDASLNPTTIWYADSDADGYGDVNTTQVQCAQPGGFVRDATDCNDAASAAYPGATEVCDGLDNDCSGQVDGSDAQDQPVWYADADGDGYGDPSTTLQQCDAPSGYVSDNADCDDTNDELTPLTAWYADADRDGFGAGDPVVQCAVSGDFARDGGDCDDAVADVYPGASRVCDDVDHDCDGKVDFDEDGDGGSANRCGGGDCDDSDASVVQCGVTPESALRDCKAIRDAGVTEDGTYFIDPDGDGDTSNAIEVLCDMTTDGGGWTLTWSVDAEHFDGVYANNPEVNPNPPVALNDQRDVWNPPTDLPVSQVLYGCTNNSNEVSFWRYNSDESLDYWIGSTDYGLQSDKSSAETNSSVDGGCFSTKKAGDFGGWLVIEEGDACESCGSMLWGAYHYVDGRNDCNNTDDTFVAHPSPYDGRIIGYPLCDLEHTSTGRFWMGVR